MERRHKKYYSRVRAIFADTDAMQVVYHVNYIKWFEIGRNEMLRQSGYPYTEMVDDGIWMPVVEVGCEYKSPAIYDDLIEISAWIEYVKGAVVMIGYECKNEETGKLYVKGFTKACGPAPWCRRRGKSRASRGSAASCGRWAGPRESPWWAG